MKEKGNFVHDLEKVYNNFVQGITGDLKWVIIGIVALALGAMYAASVGVAEASIRERDDV